MGKDSTRNLLNNNTTRLYCPWQPNENKTWAKKSHKFGLLSKDDDFEAYIDEDMTKTILRIEQEQLEKIERLREEDSVDDGLILRQAQKLDIHSSSKIHQFFKIPPSDHDLIETLSVPQKQLKPLITLEQIILSKEAFKKDNNQSLPATNSQVIQIYKKIGCSLARLQSTNSRLPKALKIIPSLSNWDEILFLTNPLSWTPQATFEVTRLFLTNVKATQTKQYFQLVLLHAIRSNIRSNPQEKLDPALFISLKKALACNPALFIKGLLFPLFESNSCTVSEACILANVIAQTKIPALQSATALLKLSEQLFTLPTCIFVQIFIEKRQALPYRVVDILSFKYFCQREEAIKQLPLMWYQSLYVFTRSYSIDMVPTQKRALLTLIQRVTKNDEISFAIENTIKSAIKSNEEELETDDSDDTIVYNDDTNSNNTADGMLID
ncbi:hypothetical protein INT46_010096 [Mucor plumbeus]|uniref:Bystin n=1 Tax=Mucor plumbeus TaxID=97098 RepID=A0A8H7R0W0_9FUNG|nr:hypothetical protein INT46_010096 [Mucor plumbeus]